MLPHGSMDKLDAYTFDQFEGTHAGVRGYKSSDKEAEAAVIKNGPIRTREHQIYITSKAREEIRPTFWQKTFELW